MPDTRKNGCRHWQTITVVLSLSAQYKLFPCSCCLGCFSFWKHGCSMNGVGRIVWDGTNDISYRKHQVWSDGLHYPARDDNFCGRPLCHIWGMSIPPLMMRHVANTVRHPRYFSSPTSPWLPSLTPNPYHSKIVLPVFRGIKLPPIVRTFGKRYYICKWKSYLTA